MGGEATRFTRRSQGAPAASPLGGAVAASLRGELEGARWDQGKGQALSTLSLEDAVAVPGAQGGILALLGTTYADGSAARYCMPARQDEAGTWHGALPDDPVWAALARLASEGAQAAGDHGLLVGVPGASGGAGPRAGSTTRMLDADQSNTSVVLDDRVVLKCYRRLREGLHPERELLEGLTRVGSRRSPAFAGALTYRRDGTETTIACAYAYVPGAVVGWEPAIAELAAALDGPPDTLARLAAGGADLGRCVGELHSALRDAFGTAVATGSEARAARYRADTSFGEGLIAATQTAPELAVLADPTRRALDGLALLEGTSLQRIHGDLHVGQLVRGPAGTVVLDFEGDPTLPTEARRHRSSPLADVASLLLSLDHVAAAAARRHGLERATARALAWSAAARVAVLDGYRDAGDGVRLDPELLLALEVEKEWRELAYAARVLPEWLYAPRVVLPALLERATG